jgi:hypothetical protein|tara:strand:+ start:131 stop:373 length:243 start_codon:yes stop_codon:yes gene_type:complete
MASTTSLSDLVAIRDKLITAYKNLAQEGVSSYSIGDQTFTLKDTKDILEEIQQLDKLIALKDSTLGGTGRNRITLRSFNG